MTEDETSAEELLKSAELREVIADEVNAKSNVLQAEAQFESAKWTKYSALGTFFMALSTVFLAIITYLG